MFESLSVATVESSVEPETFQATEYCPTIAEDLLQSWRYQVVKRAIDFVFSITMLLALLIPGLLIAAVIVLTSNGPVFYREERVGRNGRLFRIWKFRSMYCNAPERASIATPHPSGKVLEWRMRKHLRDPRITTIGVFLRSWSLDEIPQLFNILRGEMSLIGPRPIIEAETVFYGKLLSFYLAATPGLSGLWQVSGRSHIDYTERAKLDASYVQSWSLKSDVDILFRTIPAVLGRVGAR